jgi:hypothetical protein
MIRKKWFLFLAFALLSLSPFPAFLQTGAANPLGSTDAGIYGTPLSKPAYDSGWVDVGPHGANPVHLKIYHNLEGDRDSYLVHLQCYDDSGLGVYDCVDSDFNLNAYWHDLSTSLLWVTVIAGVRPDYVRVFIYLDTPEYDSGWDHIPIRPDPLSETYTHNLQSGNFLVDLTCSSPTHGYYDCNALPSGSFEKAALWHHFNTDTINVRVRSGSEPNYVRMRIYRKMYSVWSRPIFFSGGPNPSTELVAFGSPELPEENAVQIWCYDNAGDGGINECTDQAFEVTGSWFDLQPGSVQLRGMSAQDRSIGVFIWAAFQQFMPITLQD